ncbi:hypothetical protein T459_03684 [Capsicum annuum]|uniref:Tryptophan aminotransferase-related protein 4-like n=1 Tax=Capsicum annuum TaxID=4072 RepID=A0A2G3ANJ2_CAPAN|nr:hypothetical protein T459_03684 [Capsicum annuum]
MDVSSVNLNWSVCLSFSVIVNLICIMLIFSNKHSEKLNWTREAAIAAENVASTSCSGHGRAYLDGLITENGRPICECNACYTGPDCSVIVPNCAVDADSKMQGVVALWWLGGTEWDMKFEDGYLISKQLENIIHKLHETVGNANTANKYILFGSGSSQLLNAAVYALSHTTYSSSSSTKVVASAPYYPVYKSQTELLDFKEI